MIKLLVADDHVVLRQALCEMLEKSGDYQIVGQAQNGQEVLDALKSGKPDVIIMDLAMPNVDGIQALEKMKELAAVPPVLILSAQESEHSVRRALKAGAKGFIPKNVALHELKFAIDSILEGKTYLSPSVAGSLLSPGAETSLNESLSSVLTKREIEILTHLADGKPNREIGKLLHISTRTVDTHRSNILKKLNMRTNAELVKLAIASGLITV